MKLSDFDYNLPKELIAQEPIRPRDHSRLLVMEKNTGKLIDKHFYDIVDYLDKGDLLVLNNTKVFPARLIGKKKDTGGKVEVFLLRKVDYDNDCLTPPHPPLAKGRETNPTPSPPLAKGREVWQCLMAGRGRKEGLEIEFDHGLKAVVIDNNDDGTWNARFNKTGKSFMNVVNKIGLTPLPPYIKRISRIAYRASHDKTNYQTVYADDKKIGSVAAPTAGLHFTPRLLEKIKDKGVEIVYVTLHVGLGTFAPVKEENIKKHKMHAEWIEADRETIAKIYLAKSQGRKITAVGTTSIRTLEAIVSQFPISNFQFPKKLQISNSKFIKQFSDFANWVNIFIFPGYKFKIVDALITNFHLPKSTLLMLISAFAGKGNIDKAYQYAIKRKYRFYSYGDAMFIANRAEKIRPHMT